MSAHVLLYVVLMDPSIAAADSPITAVAPAPWTAEELRDAYRDLTFRTARMRDVEPAEVAPELIVLYVALYEEIDLPGAELVTMRRRTRNRLEDVRERLQRERFRLDQQAQRQRRRSASAQRGAGAATFGGATSLQGERASAQELIDLITATIEPQSWQDSGGRGSISYYQPLKVLVIRNNQRVHEQIGGLLD